MPKVTILIPCYNYGKYLRECIASAKAQTYKDIEIMVVNDGSTDDTSAIALEENVILVERENGGLAAARNTGIKICTGEYLIMLDADDRLKEDYVEKLLPLCAKGIAQGGIQSFGDTTQYTAPSLTTLENLKYSNSIFQSSMFKKECWEKVGGYDESMRNGAEDWEFWLRVIKAGYSCEITNDTHYFYRAHSDSMTWTHLIPNLQKTTEFIHKKHPDLYQGL